MHLVCGHTTEALMARAVAVLTLLLLLLLLGQPICAGHAESSRRLRCDGIPGGGLRPATRRCLHIHNALCHDRLQNQIRRTDLDRKAADSFGATGSFMGDCGRLHGGACTYAADHVIIDHVTRGNQHPNSLQSSRRVRSDRIPGGQDCGRLPKGACIVS